ncbi:MAG: hypothetical protein WCQ99_15535 [Pseudomonadota bacterium]
MALYPRSRKKTGQRDREYFFVHRHAGIASLLLLYLIVPACAGSKSTDAQKKPSEPAVVIKAQTDRTAATIAEPVTFTLSARYARQAKVRMPEVGSQIAGLRIVDFGEDGPREIDTSLEYKKWYRLQADIAGSYIIPSLTVSYTEGDGAAKELKTPQIFIEVKTALKDEKGEALKDILDIKPLQEVKRDLRPFIIAGAAGLVLIASIAGALLYMKRRKKKARESIRPAHVIALEELEKLNNEHLIEKGIVRDHYFRLSDIFRHYIENRFSVPAVEQTTQELLPVIGKLEGLSSSVKSSVREALFHADMVKFAKYAPPREEIDVNHQRVVSIINETKREEPLVTGQ